jgi:hypothetical protein
MATIDLKRRPRQEGPLTAQPVLEPAEERDPFEEQERVARAVGRSPIQEAALEVEEGHPGKPLEEGAYWDPEKHPRWPKGTPLAGSSWRSGSGSS